MNSSTRRSSSPAFFLGVGLSEKAVLADGIALCQQILTGANIEQAQILALASIDLKRDNGLLKALSAHLGADLLFFSAERLQAETQRLLNPSDRLFKRLGCHGVAEAAALAAAGEGASLLVGKTKLSAITMALAAR